MSLRRRRRASRLGEGSRRPPPRASRLRRLRGPLAAALGLVGAAALAGSSAPEGPAGQVPERLRQPGVAGLRPLFCRATRVADGYSNSSSGYTATAVGPDGKVYLGTANYYDYGYWLRYDPEDRSVEPVLSIREVTAEHLFDVNTQGKTHTDLAVGPDGRIYGGTKQGHELFRTRPEIGEEPGGYPGGHLIAYDPAVGAADDLGVLRAQDGLMNCLMDPRRRRIYLKTEPRTHFLIYELDTREVIDKGRVGTWNRIIDMDAQGNVWIPNEGRLTCYDVERDELLDYRVPVEGDGPAYRRPYACVAGGRGEERNMKLYGGDLRQIQEFDLARREDDSVPMRYVCPSVPEPFAESKDIHTMIRDRRGRIYWPAVVQGSPDELLIVRYDPERGESECLGYAVDPELDRHENVKGNHTGIQGSALGKDGTLYLMATYPLYVLEFPRLAAE